jgi:hypothetical protein
MAADRPTHEPPTLAELIERGDLASENFWLIVDEFCQERQTLLYNVKSVRLGIQRINDGKRVTSPPS